MENSEKGYIKFNCSREEGELEIDRKDLADLNFWREKMFAMNLIGAYPDGIGFGNISIRHPALPGFVISGSATGHLQRLGIEHYAHVISYSFEDNSLSCIGKVKASSESLSHAVIYETAGDVNAVIHVHSRKYWNALINREPSTSVEVEYGTPAMASEIKKVMKQHHLYGRGLIVMGGHEEGIICFGKDLRDAGTVILDNLK